MGAITICDATQAVGWLPLDAEQFDAVTCTAYKWLMSPRGSAFLVVSDRLLERVVPHSAGWYAGEDVHSSYFGPPLRLAAQRPPARPVAGLVLLGRHRAGAGADRARSACRRSTTTTSPLANRFRAGAGLEPGNSAIVCADLPGAARAPRRGRDRRGRPRRSAAHLVARLQRRARRGPGARRGHGIVRLMRRSTEEILTTHTGSLPRPPELVEALRARDRGEAAPAGDLDAAGPRGRRRHRASARRGPASASSTTARRARSATRPTSRSAWTGSEARAAWPGCRRT